MVGPELARLVALLRQARTDLMDVEVKAAAGGLPKSVRDTLSAFSNDRGGTLLLGLDENDDFRPAVGFDAARIRDALASACSDDLHPPVRAEIDIVPFGGSLVVVGEVGELDPRFKPCYVAARGEYNGSFTRGGDGDRRLTDFEIHLLHTNRGQPEDDRQPVANALPEDLESVEVRALVDRVRLRQPRAFANLSSEQVLRRLNVLAEDQEGRLRPTLGGLLALGAYPQQFFPQLNVTFVVYPGLSAEDVPVNGPRFLDNRSFDGPIPVMVDEAVTAVLRNTSVRSFVEGAGRTDVYDYPAEAVREAVANALLHRDYSPYSRGAPVQITLYADRLVVANPGGLFGAVTTDDLGGEGVTSTRNSVLAKLLQDVRLPESGRMVCENRASGIPTMLRELRRIGSPPPEFHSRITRFKVVMPRHALLGDETMRWIAGLHQRGLTPTQHLALAEMRAGRPVTNGSMRNLGLEAHRATAELSDLVNRGVAVRIGERRHARYVLAPADGSAERGFEALPPARSVEEEVLAAFTDQSELSRRELEQCTGLSWTKVLRALNTLEAQGRIAFTAPARSPHRRYRRVDER
ncbi:putative DNA binding domain-containing protein [Couchioplanes caeruleus]|uniref:ATP-binding protein n=1 Tax=Couchioplanes caeruleus TaxID=56438 RepID=UPI0020BDD3BC|nr:ATP-binding protein [Couchioplanes caeruleus]UQU66012.1 putative DNA binding domain-containing protein [Couchioplanes caeruleus]